MMKLLRRFGIPAVMIALITALHYVTPHGGADAHAGHTGHVADPSAYPWYENLHGIYRRLYYLPIILAAFRGGIRGGLLAALVVIGLYLPHAAGLIGHDPGTPVEKFMEMALYLAVGLLTGTLVARINAARDRLQRSAQDLKVALEAKNAMEAELIRSARLAAVGRLSAGLAHEIRNPLASIQGSAEVLADDFPEDHPKARLLSIMLEETGRLNQVLTRFLTFARSETPEIEAFDLAAEIQAVVEMMRHHDGAPPMIFEAPASGFDLALGNREQIRQVLFNLALTAAEAAGPTGTVTVEIESGEFGVRCRVRDDGPGFTEEALNNFGTPFYSSRAEGTGLGLATSLRIVENQGGTLDTDPSRGPGACLVMTLPAAGSEARG